MAKDLWKHRGLYVMVLPGLLLLILFSYLPMFGVVIAFKTINYTDGILASPWSGLDNFGFLVNSKDALLIVRNTVLYNTVFIFGGLALTVGIAIALHEMLHKQLAKVYQSMMFLPYILSWVLVAYVVYAFLSPTEGFVNKAILEPLGFAPVFWYSEPKYWPAILIFCNYWKYTGYGVVIYLAALSSIDPTYYEAAMIDGANKRQQIWSITVPMLKPLMTILTILAVGRIFSADFGLFYNVPLNQGFIRSTTYVIDTYVFNSLSRLGNLGMASAAAFVQSIVGFVLVLSSNWLVRRINKDDTLF